MFGSAGVVVVSLTALVATASAINAGLFSATNVSYQMAKDGEFPWIFTHRCGGAARGSWSAGSSSR